MSAPDTMSNLLASDSEAFDTCSSRLLACPVCRSSNWHPALSVRRAPLSCCAQCGLLATTSFVTGAKTLSQLYDVDAENLAVYRKQYLPHRVAFYSRFLSHLERFRQTGRLLEVGSGYGFFLEMASQARWDCEGVEISAFCCQIARQRGCKVWEGELADAGLRAGTFDVVVLWDVIEHFVAPDEIIRCCCALLRQGGALVMRTPDARALAPTLQPARAAYKHLAYPANTAEHVFHFTPRDLSAIVTRLGFKSYEVDFERPWRERVISGNHSLVRACRSLIMRYAHWRGWPYEFVLTAVKAD